MTNWQTKKLGDVMDFIPTGSHSRNDMTIATGDEDEVLNIHYGDIHTKYSTYVDCEEDSVPALKDNNIRAQMLLKDGDLVVADASEDYDGVGSCVELRNVSERKVIGGLHTFALRSKNDEFAPGFTGIMLKNPATHKRLMQVSVYSKVYGLTKSSIAGVDVSYPEKPEQERIVGVLEVWDEYIEKLEQKIALKEQLKKGLMQQLLTGKRRLPGFEGDWQKLKLSDIAKIRKGTQLNRSTLSENMAGLNKYAVINGGITPSGYTDTMNTKAGAITISEGGNSCGYVNYIKKDFWLGGHCYEIINNQKVDQIYLYPFLKANQSKIMSLRVGSGLPNIQKSSLENLKVLLPETKKEQEDLGLIMLHSVTEIEQLSEKLQIMKLQKKYLLKNLITGTIRTPEDLQPLDSSRLERSAL